MIQMCPNSLKASFVSCHSCQERFLGKLSQYKLYKRSGQERFQQVIPYVPNVALCGVISDQWQTNRADDRKINEKSGLVARSRHGLSSLVWLL
jgi:hypothetical protein